MNRVPGLLHLDETELVSCVSCGLCLPHCPTYRVTGLEIASPRGRIAAMRLVELEGAPIDSAFETAMNECVQCRGCEAACPSSVQFGHLMEDTRAALHDRTARGIGARRTAEWIAYRLLLPVHWLLLAVTWAGWLLQRLRVVPRRFGLPNLSARSLATPLDVPSGGKPSAWCFTGCVMDAWLRDTHRSTVRVMRAAGAEVARPGRGGDCCGALHVHAGRTREAQQLARRVMASMPGTAPIVVNSAGCGAVMKDYGRMLGTAEAAAFSARVRDFSEWVVEQGVPAVRQTSMTVVVQDACHLRHVQRAHGAVRAVLAPAYALVETDDDGLCCGAGGAYAVLQPALSTDIRDRKADALRRARPGAVVVSANPGCMMQLRQAGLDVRHPADLLADALQEEESRRTRRR
ncbi:MAG: glycolate oxidase iron-sulfur subunit [Actinomycetota bacterium]|nr:glycolate oxidase iron-sulfur subunit [Actinomycetota bacterium]